MYLNLKHKINSITDSSGRRNLKVIRQCQQEDGGAIGAEIETQKHRGEGEGCLPLHLTRGSGEAS